ncbi:MAG: hypothetical protein WAK40_03650 [Thermoplasmata archaeon]
MGAPTGRRASAFAPGHVTGAFAPRTEARDPRARGSVGIGLVLDLGVVAEAEWRASDRPRVSVTASGFSRLSISTDVARRLLARRPGRLSVRLYHQLPVGQGFGMSAAGALATALSVGRLVGVPRRRAVETAHLADLFGGGGLGGVAAILGGGLEVRRRPGIPPFGEIVHRAVSDPVFVVVVGRPIPSPQVLSDPRRLGLITAAFDQLGDIGSPPTLERFWTASERFTDRLAWAPTEVRDTVRAIRRRGGRAAQAMFGRSVFATLPPEPRRSEVLGWMQRHGVRAVELSVGRGGARVRRSPPRD